MADWCCMKYRFFAFLLLFAMTGSQGTWGSGAEGLLENEGCSITSLSFGWIGKKPSHSYTWAPCLLIVEHTSPDGSVVKKETKDEAFWDTVSELETHNFTVYSGTRIMRQHQQGHVRDVMYYHAREFSLSIEWEETRIYTRSLQTPGNDKGYEFSKESEPSITLVPTSGGWRWMPLPKKRDTFYPLTTAHSQIKDVFSFKDGGCVASLLNKKLALYVRKP